MQNSSDAAAARHNKFSSQLHTKDGRDEDSLLTTGAGWLVGRAGVARVVGVFKLIAVGLGRAL